MTSLRLRFLALAAVAASVAAPPAAPAVVNRPFGSHPMTYAAGAALPGHLSQAALDQAVADFYDQWKQAYLAEACGNGRYVVLTKVGSGNLTVSEGHGYGMMLVALMAGHDPDAQTIFDGMYGYFREHPTALHPRLMSWNQNKGCADVQGHDSATDGDLDIAYALLLADKQWGSCGAVDYHGEALAMLADIRDGDVDATASYPLLGDWTTPSEPSYYLATRASDFVVDHFASFEAASADPVWGDLRDSIYDIVAAVQAEHASATGLLPDFLVDPATDPAPAPAGFLEGPNDGSYSYNACRVPWRLATDFVVSGDLRAKAALDAINDWIRGAVAGDPSAIGAGYRLDGSPIPGTDYLAMSFVGPFAAGAMVDAGHPEWLEDLWDRMVATPIEAEAYYENTLKLLAMMLVSGNWWAPETVAAPACTPTGTDECTNPAFAFDVRVDLRRFDAEPGRQSMKLRGALFFPAGAPADLDEGAQLLVEDVGSGDAALFELTEATVAVPSASDPVCSTRDGWKVSPTKALYRNKSGAMNAPLCTDGTSEGLFKLLLRARTGFDVEFSAATKRSSMTEPVGPLRLTVVLGKSAADGDAGRCGVSRELACSGTPRRLLCQ